MNSITEHPNVSSVKVNLYPETRNMPTAFPPVTVWSIDLSNRQPFILLYCTAYLQYAQHRMASHIVVFMVGTLLT